MRICAPKPSSLELGEAWKLADAWSINEICNHEFNKAYEIKKHGKYNS